MVDDRREREETDSGASPHGGVLALGNFDGVHLGHQAVIAATIERARAYGVPARALTLEPHPRSLLNVTQTPFRLTSASAKARLLQKMGIDDVITLNFSPEFASQSAHEFVEQILVQHYRAKHVVAGATFVFGHKRAGTMPHMRAWLEPHGIGVTEVPPLCDAKGEPVSSSRVRTALHKADLATARELLGRPWSITGIIAKGARRGRVLGFPTANMELGDYVRPVFGVYAIKARHVGHEKLWDGVANVGTRPTVGGMRVMLEFHVFQTPGELYDQAWEVELHHFLRPEKTFASLDALQGRIMEDVAQAKELLAKTPA
jgi:riboflavin kinase/FMN adenylyltransferase